MKKIIIIAMIILLPYVSFAGMAEDEWSGSDKTLHLGVSALISSVVTTFYLKHDVTWWKSALVGIGAATLVGLVKECMDSPRTGFSYKDLTWGVGGGMLGAVIVIPFNYNFEDIIK